MSARVNSILSDTTFDLNNITHLHHITHITLLTYIENLYKKKKMQILLKLEPL